MISAMEALKFEDRIIWELRERIKIDEVEQWGYRYIGETIKQEKGKKEIDQNRCISGMETLELQRFREERALILEEPTEH